MNATDVTGTNYTGGAVKLNWSVPKQANGMIVSYTIRYKRQSVEHSTGTDLCVTHENFLNHSQEHIIQALENGNYSFTVMATSFAGNGPWTPLKFVEVNVRVKQILYYT